ncbi:histidine kinase dimerization/phosphoacceptor domain -containing protein [Chryseolinea soli]|uniref:histidine kinase n=1 Tax=Chryseolinea soli TaxID=2321403 RepID=A0A385SUJ2_9BACT|nr:histidine kinase dimerization/phosphoacceptor domain -containing protein [Chryseolinea soli]AYB34879.1 hypothetical protein D4L85_31765 [Chryseolinea soli]
MCRRLALQILFLTSFFATKAQTIPAEQTSRRIHELSRALKETGTDSSRAKLLLELALCYVYKPGEFSGDLDSAKLLVSEAEQINGRLHDKKTEARAYFVYAAAHREKGDRANGKAYIESSLKIYESISDPANMAEAWVERSRYYSISESAAEIKEMRKCLDKALALFRTTGSRQRQADVLKDLGDLDQILGNAELAMKELNEALSIYKSVGHKSLQGIYDLMGYIFGKKGDLHDAVRFGLLAVKTGEEVKDTTLQMCTIYVRLAVAYAYLSDFDQAIPNANKALSIAIKYNDRSSILVCTEINCLFYSRLGKEAASIESIRQGEAALQKPWSRYDSLHLNLFYVITYVSSKKFEKARPYVDEMERLLKGIQKDVLTFSTFHFLVTYYLNIRQFNKAETTMSDYLSVLVPNNGKRHMARAYLLKSQLDSARGNFKSALVNYQLHKSLTDSILNEASTFQFAQMEVEHETEKKDNDIKLLKQQQIIQEASLQQSLLLRNIVIGGVVALALLSVLLYGRYRTKQGLYKQLQAKQQEVNEKNVELENLVADKDELLIQKEWLVREIHHRVKNNLQIVTSLLTSQMDSTENGAVMDAIRESRNRIEAIAMIHQRLYNTNNYGSIMMPAYVVELVEHLREAYGADGRIVFSLFVDPISLDISVALPVGLILNEAISNAMKHAFPGEIQGTIAVRINKALENKVIIEVEDDGIGFSEKVDGDSVSFGIRLIKGLASDLSGESQMFNGKGTTVRVVFSIDGLLKQNRLVDTTQLF